MRAQNLPAVSSARIVRTGFSLVELTVSVLIMGILAGVTVPRMMHMVFKYRAESAAARVAADLRFAGKQARTRGRSETVTFDLATSRYSFSSIKDPNATIGIYSVDLTTYPYQGAMQSVSFAGSSSVTFDGYGFPDGSGTVAVTAGDVVRTVKLHQASGKVSMGSD